jgi:hypothetical protein
MSPSPTALSNRTKYIVIGVVVVLLAGLGYYLYKKSSHSSPGAAETGVCKYVDGTSVAAISSISQCTPKSVVMNGKPSPNTCTSSALYCAISNPNVKPVPGATDPSHLASLTLSDGTVLTVDDSDSSLCTAVSCDGTAMLPAWVGFNV